MSQRGQSPLVVDLMWKIRGLAQYDPETRMDRAIRILEDGRRDGVTALAIYKAVFKVITSILRLLLLLRFLLLLLSIRSVIVIAVIFLLYEVLRTRYVFVVLMCLILLLLFYC